jgi:hypothetical protein
MWFWHSRGRLFILSEIITLTPLIDTPFDIQQIVGLFVGGYKLRDAQQVVHFPFKVRQELVSQKR